MPGLLFNKQQIVGITELQRNAGSVSSRVKEYGELVEKAEQAEIYGMLSKRKGNQKWLKTSEVLEGLDFSKGSDTIERSGHPHR